MRGTLINNILSANVVPLLEIGVADLISARRLGHTPVQPQHDFEPLWRGPPNIGVEVGAGMRKMFRHEISSSGEKCSDMGQPTAKKLKFVRTDLKFTKKSKDILRRVVDV